MKFCLRLFLAAFSLASFSVAVSLADDSGVSSPLFEARIVNDWKRQEAHLDRSIDSPEALNDLIGRLEAVVERLAEEELCDVEKLDALRDKIADTKALDLSNASEEEREAAYCSLRWQARRTIFANELFKDVPLVFIKGNYLGFQVLQEYLSYYARFGNLSGGGVFRLNNPGFSFETTELTSEFPLGHYNTLNMSYDAKEIYFSYADMSAFHTPNPLDMERVTMIEIRDEKDFNKHMPEYLAEPRGKYHLFKTNLETGETTQLTDGPNDDIDAIQSPDGSLIFLSMRRGGFARCNGQYEPIEVETLHKLTPDGKVVPLSWHETNEWTPAMLHDGRVIYTRWDYVDRNAARFQGLWWTNPDGTSASSIFGSYTEEVCVCLQPEPIPNSEKIMFVAAGHHLGIGGSLVILDPTKIAYGEDGHDKLDAIERITPEIPFPETPDGEGFFHIPDHYYSGPYPFSEDFYFVAYSHDPMGGYLPTNGALSYETIGHGKTGLYYRDRFGNLELMYEDDRFECRYPLPILERETPALIPSKLTDSESEYGTFNLVNAYDSVFPMPEDRRIKELRVFQILPKFPTHAAEDPKIGHDFAGNARMYLGTVPVEEDGSAYFKAPACKPLYFQAVDESGKAVQTMLSEVYLQPSENRGCVGCHEQLQSTADNAEQRRIALNRAPSELTPGPEGTKPFSYPILIQPILDRACVSCHDGEEKSASPALTGEPEGRFNVSYQNLAPYLRWYEWLYPPSINQVVSLPGECGADMSPLTSILEDENHKDKTGLTEEDKRKIYLWLDANIPFYGSYDAEVQERQRNGESVPPPTLQ